MAGDEAQNDLRHRLDVAEARTAELQALEHALRESEAKYRTLFETMGQGFALAELVRHASGAAINYRLLELNPAIERLLGVSVESTLGKLVTDVFPGIEPEWIETFDRVIRSGKPERLMSYFGPVDQWIEVQVYPAGGDRFIAIYDDVTERKRRERNADLLDDIGKHLSVLSSPEDIIQTVGGQLGKFLQASGCIFADVDEARNEATIHHGWNTADVPSLKQTFRLADYFGEEFRRAGRAGEAVTVCDTANDSRADAEAYARLQLGAFVTVPFQRQGRWVANITVTTRGPRKWRSDEIALVQEIASRVFPRIERARAEAALRDSEQNLHGVANVVPDLLWYSAPDGSTPWYNDRWLEYTGQTLEQASGSGWLDAIHPDDREESARRYSEAVEQSKALHQEHRIRNAAAEYRWFLVRAEPLRNADGRVTRMYGAATDIHDQRLAMEALRESEERQVFLLGLSDALRPLSDAVEIQAVASRFLGEYLGGLRTGCGEIEGDELVVRADYTNGVASMIGRYPIDTFGPALTKAYREGGICVVRYAADDPDLTEPEREQLRAVHVAAHVTIVIRKPAQQTLSVGVHSNIARVWKDSEILLIQEMAERTWAATVRARAEQAKRESEERFRLFVGNVLEYALVQTDSNGLVTSWNPGAERLFGYTSAEVLGRPFSMLLPQEERRDGDVAREMAQLSEGEKVIDAHTVQRKNGSRFWAEWVTEPVLDASGKLRGTAKVMRDETERRSAQRSLQESEQRLRTVLEGIPQLVWRSLDEGRWTWSSPQWQQFTGQSLEESQDKGWLDVIHPEDRSRTMAAWKQAQTSGMLDVEHRIRRVVDGNYVWHQTRSVPSSDGSEGAVEWLGTSTDIAAAKQANAEKEALLKEVHHRVKNNLQVITSLINLQSSQIKEEGVRSQFDETRNRILSIASIHELLYRSESFADIDLVGYARQLTTDLVQFYGLGGRVRTEFTRKDVSIELERAVPYGLLVNELISNALKHGFPADRSGWVRVDVSQEGAQVCLLISDDGIGIPKSFSLGTTQSLGMRLIHALTEQLGGTI